MENKTSQANTKSAEINMIMDKFQADINSDRIGEALKILDDEAVFEMYDNAVIDELCARQSKNANGKNYFIR